MMDMKYNSSPRGNPLRGRATAMAIVLLALSACATPVTQQASAQQRFDSAAAAVDALVAAVRADQPDTVVALLGPESRELVYSGDAVADDSGRERFVLHYDRYHAIEMDGADRATLVIGDKRWPFPIPVIRQGDAWRFDTGAGRSEILDRRIGRNELGAITAVRAIVDAQRDYVARVPGGDGVVEYARKFISSAGMRDGLYWPAAAGEPESPIGPLLARARAEGYEDGYGEAEPYHGYFYKFLARQGPAAADGAYEYMADGRMIGGFALVAFPASYGSSGIMTFIVNQDGIVYQKNLGPETVEAARVMDTFDPDASWTRVPD